MTSATTPSPAPEDAERISLFVENIKDYAIFMLSPEGVVTSWNAGAERSKGYKAEEIIGQHFSRFYCPEDQAADLPGRALRSAIETGKFEHEGWRVRKDGSTFWASVVIDPIRDAGGTLLGFAKVTRDITEQKKASDALHASEEQFRILVQGVTDYAIYMLSPAGIITNWNAGAQRIKGYADDEVVGTHFSRFYIEEDRQTDLPMKALENAAAKGSFENEGWRLRKDGTKFWAHVVMDPIYSPMGDLVGFAKITRDITERRSAAEALEKTKEALFQSQKLESIGRLTGGVAHDFNNLLSVIGNGLEILRMMVKSEAAAKVLESMERATDRGANLTKQLLTFARQQPLQLEQHDVNKVICSFGAVLRRANTSRIKFGLALAPSLPMVLMDATQFETALLNLVVNAGDAMTEGGTVSVSTEAVALGANQVNKLAEGVYVKVSVSDTGEGIHPDVIPKVFEPFFTTKPVGKGTGLGLSQVYGFAQQSGGDLTVSSTLGEGTVITLYLPSVTEDVKDPGPTREAQDKALVVDDQPDVLDMTVELFRNLGYEVLSANNGDEALAILKKTPDLSVLFSDVVMPGMSGIELGEIARKLVPKVNIVLVSGYAEPALETGQHSLEQFQFIAKPYRLAEIVKKLRIA